MTNEKPSLWEEIKRRKIVRFGLIYAAVGWILIQVASATFPNLGLPEWAPTLVIVIVALGFPLVLVLAWAHETAPPGAAETSEEKEVAEQGLVTDLPSIAVLPFENMSDDREQEYLADGMTEDIITGLAKLPQVFVVARNSTFTYKGQNPDIRKVGRELGVRYVLEGSIRPIGERVRITGQLIETATGGHLWSENYDRPLRDLFEVQDEVVSHICDRLGIEMNQAEYSRAQKASPDEMTAWTYTAKAQSLTNFRNQDNFDLVQGLLENALAVDPNNAYAMAMLGHLHAVRVVNLNSKDIDADQAKANELITRARRLAPQDAGVLSYFGEVHALFGDHGTAIEALELAQTLAPNSPQLFRSIGFPLVMSGRAEEGIAALEEGMRRDPVGLAGQGHSLTHFYIGIGYGVLRDFERAISSLRISVREYDLFSWPWFLMSAFYAQLGKESEALDALQHGRALTPEATFEEFATQQRKLSIDQETTAIILEGIEPLWDKAG